MFEQEFQRIQRKKRDLDSLIAIVPATGELTYSFLDACAQSSVTYGRKSSLLRVLLMDDDLAPGKRQQHPQLWFENVCTYLDYLLCSKESLKHIEPHSVPRAIKKLFGVEEKANARVVYNRIAHDLDLLIQKGADFASLPASSFSDVTKGNFLFETRTLDPQQSTQFLQEGGSAQDYKVFFDTGIVRFDARNMLRHAHAIVNLEASGKEMQDKIPQEIAGRFEITRLSVPELMIMTDVAYMMYHGIVAPPTDSSSRGELLEALVSDKSEIAQNIMGSDSAHWFLTREKVALLENQGGRYRSSMLYNVLRMVDREYPSFRSYYDAIDDATLRDKTLEHFDQHAEDVFVHKLEAALDTYSEEFSGIGIRELANIMYKVHLSEEENPAAAIPPVARYRMGAQEYEATGQGSKRHKNRDQIRMVPRIELLDNVVCAKTSEVFLLHPSYSGTIPSGSVYIPASVAAMYEEIPEGVKIAGAEKLAWGENPYSSLADELNVRAIRHLR